MEGEPRKRKSRSRSPARRAPASSKGFRWKDSSRDKGSSYHDSSARRRRDYRERSPERQRQPRGRDGQDYERQFGRDNAGSGISGLRSPRRHDAEAKIKSKTEKQKKTTSAPAVAAAVGQEMIVVYVNDRLGTKSAIPCLPSDTIGQLKLMIAARIGREPNQIMLRRQGERPFKDMLSLEDYGISNGVQLDLEVDTGD